MWSVCVGGESRVSRVLRKGKGVLSMPASISQSFTNSSSFHFRAGVVVRRLYGGMSLEDYMIENIWKTIGISAPFPTFTLSKHPEYKARLMGHGERTPNGELKPTEYHYGDNLVDQEGGAGLVLGSDDFLAVLTDLISDSPKLLTPETISMMFVPQIAENSIAKENLLKARPFLNIIAGPVADEYINHGLGGMLALGDVPEFGQPKNILGWAGATHPTWFINKDAGVAGFCATQITPFGDAKVKELINAWMKDFWSHYDATP